MKKLLFILVILALCAVLAAGGALALARVQNARLDVTEYALSPDGLPAAFDGFTIAQISDYHGDAACRAQLLDALRPELAIISVGYNTYGHPSDETLRRLEGRGISVYRTDTMGTVTIEVRSDGYAAQSER